MIRVVRTPAGEVLVDPTGKKSGRGAYVHPEAACVQAALTAQRLERALKTSVLPEAIERLRAEMEHAVARADLLAQLAAREAREPVRKGPTGSGRRR